MTNIINRFISHAINACIPKREYTKEQVIENLTSDINLLETYLMNNDYGTKTYFEKLTALKEKVEERESFKNTNQ